MELRKIKFRGKRIDNGDWVYGDLHQLNDGSCFIGIHDETWSDDGFHSDTYDHVEEIKEDTIGQFTGLHDKNGKEIYEGDIIRTDGNNFTYEVIYNEKSAAFIGKRNSRVFGLLDLYESDTVCREIIGNIYDNKELLKTQIK